MRDEVYAYYCAALPISIRGLVSENEDGTYTVLLNPAYDTETLRKTMQHEIYHAECDYGSEGDVNMIEAESHKRQK